MLKNKADIKSLIYIFITTTVINNSMAVYWCKYIYLHLVFVYVSGCFCNDS